MPGGGQGRWRRRFVDVGPVAVAQLYTIPEFVKVGYAKAEWCGYSLQQVGLYGEVLCCWQHEWWELHGPDPRYNVYDDARHWWSRYDGTRPSWFCAS